MKFTLDEDHNSNYQYRTEVNVKNADVTFAIAIDFNSPGEKLTKKLAIKHNKIYIPVTPNGDVSLKADKIVDFINEKFFKIKSEITLNIAGNGIFTMKGIMTQEECDEFTYNLLSAIINHKNILVKVKSIRSGGQTGFDTSGIRAGIKLNLDTTAYYPKGFRIRDLQGDKTQTKEAVYEYFGINTSNKKKDIFIDMDNTLCNFVKSYNEFKKTQPQIIFPQSQYGFFKDLEPIDGAVESFKELEKHFNVYILTRPSIHNLLCYTEKADWVNKYLGFHVLKNLIIMCDKSMVKAKGAFLIDDDTQAGQLEFEGEFIHFKTDKFPDWKSVMSYLEKFK